ncbi:hypothetical protein ABZ721_10390 [Streptomyces sp. NPDC006733]|uniref:hypothetical protein n=1 Tax=Streptomyces sp. NPDC006733 TaxID=3155460 RepID=UPI0033C332E8
MKRISRSLAAVGLAVCGGGALLGPAFTATVAFGQDLPCSGGERSVYLKVAIAGLSQAKLHAEGAPQDFEITYANPSGPRVDSFQHAFYIDAEGGGWEVVGLTVERQTSTGWVLENIGTQPEIKLPPFGLEKGQQVTFNLRIAAGRTTPVGTYLAVAQGSSPANPDPTRENGCVNFGGDTDVKFKVVKGSTAPTAAPVPTHTTKPTLKPSPRPTVAPSTVPQSDRDQELAASGASPLAPAAIAGALLLVGGVGILAARRRSRHDR